MSESLNPLPADYENPNNNRRKDSLGIPAGLEFGRRAGDNRSYVTFYVAGQLLGVPIEKVQEIFVAEHMCQIPLVSQSIAGLINLRGRIVTAIDLRERLKLSKREENEDTLNIIVIDGGEVFSLIVDSIGDVLEVRRDSFEAPPSTLDASLKECCKGVHRLKKGILVILGVGLLFDERIFSTIE